MTRLLTTTALCLFTLTAADAKPFVGKVKIGPAPAVKPFVGPTTKIQPYIAPQHPHFPTPKLGFQGKMIYGQGLMVMSVDPFGIARKKGFEQYDLLVSINGEKIQSHDHYLYLLQKAVQHNGGHVRILVRNARPYPPYVSVDVYLHGHHGPVYPSGNPS